MSTPDDAGWRNWSSLSHAEQLRLREAFGHYLDDLPPTCDMNQKIERFAAWLAQQGITYPGD